MSEAAAMTQSGRGRRRTLIGTVVSVKMDKTAVVSVERRRPHPLYRKIVRTTKRYKAHDPRNEAARYGWWITSYKSSRNSASIGDQWRPTRFLTISPGVLATAEEGIE